MILISFNLFKMRVSYIKGYSLKAFLDIANYSKSAYTNYTAVQLYS